MKSALIIGSVFSLIWLVSNGFANSEIEVVQSVPIETTLRVPGIRSTQEVWLEMIDAAQTQVDLEQFYINDKEGQGLSPVLNALSKAARRGVQIRLLLDSKFFKIYPEAAKKLALLANVEVRTILLSSGGVQHAKYLIVDGRSSFVGSQNFDWLALSHIHEVGLRVTDSVVSEKLKAIFEADWKLGSAVGAFVALNLSQFEFLAEVIAHPKVAVLMSPEKILPPNVFYSGSAIVELLNSAKSSIRIQVMEYSTKVYGESEKHWLVLDSAIRHAAARGVSVQLLVDVSNLKKAKADLQALSHVKNIEIKVVSIPEWSGGHLDYARLVHSKYMTIDEIASWVGSENWSQGYFLSSRDVGLITRVPSVTEKLDLIFKQVWNSTYSSFLR